MLRSDPGESVNVLIPSSGEQIFAHNFILFSIYILHANKTYLIHDALGLSSSSSEEGFIPISS